MKDHVLCNGQWSFVVSNSEYVGGDDGGPLVHREQHLSVPTEMDCTQVKPLASECLTINARGKWTCNFLVESRHTSSQTCHEANRLAERKDSIWEWCDEGPESVVLVNQRSCAIYWGERQPIYICICMEIYLIYYAFDITHMICAMNEWMAQMRYFVYYISASAVSLYDFMNKRTSPPELLWETLH